MRVIVRDKKQVTRQTKWTCLAFLLISLLANVTSGSRIFGLRWKTFGSDFGGDEGVRRVRWVSSVLPATSDAPETGGVLAVNYINLKSRLDRKVSIEQQLSRMQIPFTRTEAVDVRRNLTALNDCWDESDLNRCAGKQGCKESHLKVLETHMLSGRKNPIVVFEDDFVWLEHVEPSYVPSLILDFAERFPDWKVIGLSMNIFDKHHTNVTVTVGSNVRGTSEIVEIRNAQTTHGYAVRSPYLPILVQAFRECNVKGSFLAAIDQCWKPLQALGGWYGFSPQLGTQKPGHSDIENTDVAYSITAE